MSTASEALRLAYHLEGSKERAANDLGENSAGGFEAGAGSMAPTVLRANFSSPVPVQRAVQRASEELSSLSSSLSSLMPTSGACKAKPTPRGALGVSFKTRLSEASSGSCKCHSAGSRKNQTESERRIQSATRHGVNDCLASMGPDNLVAFLHSS